jgi:hypothetical protein
MTSPRTGRAGCFLINQHGGEIPLNILNMAIVHENILKVLDIHYSQFSTDFMSLIVKQIPIYKDNILEEHLYSPGDIREDNKVISDKATSELDEVAQLMTDFDCGYFRIIYT